MGGAWLEWWVGAQAATGRVRHRGKNVRCHHHTATTTTHHCTAATSQPGVTKPGPPCLSASEGGMCVNLEFFQIYVFIFSLYS